MDNNAKEIIVNTAYDTRTGTNTVLGEASDEENKEKLDKMWKTFSEGNDNPEQAIQDALKEYGFSEFKEAQDSVKILSLIQDTNNGIKINSIYEKLPDFMKGEVYKLTAKAAAGNGAAVTKAALNFTASAVVKELAQSIKTSNETIDIDEMLSTLYNDLKESTNDMGKKTADMFMSTLEDRKASIEEAIKRASENNDEKAIEKLKKIEEASDRSYDLKDFIEACKKIKVKKFYIEKPSKVFDDFNYKFRSEDYPMNNITDCPNILESHGFEYNDALKLCLAFCLYCVNMNPEDYSEYIFMYYFVRNIIILDRVNFRNERYEDMDEKSKSYYDGFVKNLNLALDNLKR